VFEEKKKNVKKSIWTFKKGNNMWLKEIMSSAVLKLYLSPNILQDD
jgi:hypothetical protein